MGEHKPIHRPARQATKRRVHTWVIAWGLLVASLVSACAATGSRAILGAVLALVAVAVVWALRRGGTVDDGGSMSPCLSIIPTEPEPEPPGGRLVPPSRGGEEGFDPLKQTELQLGERGRETDDPSGATRAGQGDGATETVAVVEPRAGGPDAGAPDAGPPDARLSPCLSTVAPEPPPVKEPQVRPCLSMDVCLSIAPCLEPLPPPDPTIGPPPAEPDVAPCLSELPPEDVGPCLEIEPEPPIGPCLKPVPPPPPPEDDGRICLSPVDPSEICLSPPAPEEGAQSVAPSEGQTARAQVIERVLARADLPDDIKARLRRR